MYRRYFMIGLLSVFTILIITSCSNDTNVKKDENNIIYTSIYPIQFLTGEIVGDVAEVKSVYPPGVDAHTYEPKTKELTAIASADAFIYVGGGMESFSETAAGALEEQAVHLIKISDEKDIFLSSADGDDGHDHDLDPHIWLDPLRMISIAEIIMKELIQINPNHEEIFTEQFSNFKKSLQQLDEDFQSILSEKKNKKILVTHAAYRYWEDRYGIEQIAISGLSSSDEPSQKDLANITTLALENNIEFVLFEQTSSNRIASIVQEHIGAEQLTIHPLEVLTEEDIEENHDYMTLMYENLNTLDKAMN